MSRGVADTSVFIGIESGRPLREEELPDELSVSVITVAELEAGVLAAADTAARSSRLKTLTMALETEPLPITAAVASQWARLRVELHQAGRACGVNDLWIAATACAQDMAVVTQDNDFDALADLGLVQVIKV